MPIREDEVVEVLALRSARFMTDSASLSLNLAGKQLSGISSTH